jgi:sugar phosphate isomerase/epimerase
MQYSFMSFSCPELSLEAMLDFAKETGYDGIEPRLVSKHAHGIETDIGGRERQKAKDLATRKGIAYACVATSCRYANPESNKEHIEGSHKAIDLAADIGSKRIRVFGGKLGAGIERDAAVDLVAESLRAVADHAGERGVFVCMETHDDWCDPRHVAEIMQRVDHPNVCVNWDVMHPVRTGLATIDESFEILKSWIRHLHIHDAHKESTDLRPIGKGYVDHRRVVELLMGMGYSGYLSGEWINWDDPYPSHLPRELATMKEYERQSS